MNYSVRDSDGKLTIATRPRWSIWPLTVPLLAFLVYWAFEAYYFHSYKLPASTLAVALGVAAAQAIWILSRREMLIFTDRRVKAKRSVLFCFSRTRSFHLEAMSEPYFAPSEISGDDQGEVPSGLAFDYQGAHYRFLNCLDESDVGSIVPILREKRPDLARQWDNSDPRFQSVVPRAPGLNEKEIKAPLDTRSSGPDPV